ncbi:MAG: lysophospholipid acyltransferase family protein, partial [Bdellovibrio sp.]
QAMRSFGAISIPRENRIQALKEYDRARELFQRGEHILLAPEGTRNSSQQLLLPFKSGPFLLAQSAGVPLVPILLSGTDQIWPKHSFFPGMLATSFQVKIKILSSVPVSSSEDHKKLKEILRDRMLSHLESF